MKTVLITGCSSGYGLETARHFHVQGWNVIATMRTPREDVLPRSERLRVLALDVTKPESIAAALEASGPLDVLVNNAGIGVVGAFEATPMTTAREVFETNTFGVMAMTQAVVRQFRARRSGVVVNVTSSVTLTPMPLAAGFARKVGMPPMQYLLEWRMALAKDMLRGERPLLAEVAERVGYQSASAFSTAFTRLTGRSPSDFARSTN